MVLKASTINQPYTEKTTNEDQMRSLSLATKNLFSSRKTSMIEELNSRYVFNSPFLENAPDYAIPGIYLTIKRFLPEESYNFIIARELNPYIKHELVVLFNTINNYYAQTTIKQADLSELMHAIHQFELTFNTNAYDEFVFFHMPSFLNGSAHNIFDKKITDFNVVARFNWIDIRLNYNYYQRVINYARENQRLQIYNKLDSCGLKIQEQRKITIDHITIQNVEDLICCIKKFWCYVIINFQNR